MKSTIVLFILGLFIATVQAAMLGANAERMARGLPRVRRPSFANKPKPSKKPAPPPKCDGVQECCEVLETAEEAKGILGLLGIHVPSDSIVGLECTRIVNGGLPCIFTRACCKEDFLGGAIAAECTRSDIFGLVLTGVF
ncbi:hypothetical protein BD414DRAFT_504656 [Trametes punicea]|nr:hypothetical protein BD414DRAFT_504656 [Trametes punicea]